MSDKMRSTAKEDTIQITKKKIIHVLGVSLYLFSLTNFVHHTEAETNVHLGTDDGRDKYFPGRIFETLKPIGFQQCLKVCGENTNCLSINYNKEHLTCELLKTAAGGQTHLKSRKRYVYAVQDQMDVCKEIHCKQNSKCLRTTIGNPVCLKNLCPLDCQGIEITKVQANQVQKICPFDDGIPMEVRCETNKTHIWTIIQTRFDGSEDFYRTWIEYKNGFGNASGEYWIGNDVLHALTTSHKYQLFIEGTTWDDETKYRKHTRFSVADEDSDYTLTISGSSKTYDMSNNNGRKFATKDRPTYDKDNVSCSKIHRSGWWYTTYWLDWCTRINPNGKYHTGYQAINKKYIFWYNVKEAASLKSFLMKIRH